MVLENLAFGRHDLFYDFVGRLLAPFFICARLLCFSVSLHLSYHY